MLQVLILIITVQNKDVHKSMQKNIETFFLKLVFSLKLSAFPYILENHKKEGNKWQVWSFFMKYILVLDTSDLAVKHVTVGCSTGLIPDSYSTELFCTEEDLVFNPLLKYLPYRRMLHESYTAMTAMLHHFNLNQTSLTSASSDCVIEWLERRHHLGER